MWKCTCCKKEIKAEVKVFPVRCSCGNIDYGDDRPSDIDIVFNFIDEENPCIHRGSEFGVMNCNCAGNLNVYKCETHELCATRKLRAGTPSIMTDAGVVSREVKYCNSCKDFKMKE